VFVFVDSIEGKDQIDLNSDDAEWYYQVSVEPETGLTETIKNHNTDNGKYNGNWNPSKTWCPQKNHKLLANSRNVIIKLKLMDYDSTIEGGSDDLADVSGCNYPDVDGADNDLSDKRGAIYHGTYDLVTGNLNPYSTEPNDYADKVDDESSPGLCITRGDLSPDSSTEYEGGIIPSPQNDAIIRFSLDNDYEPPVVEAKINNLPDKIRPGDTLDFQGSLTGGTPDYQWQWDFGDGESSALQNPSHTYDLTGTYTIILTLVDGFGQSSVDSTQITVGTNSKPIGLSISGPTSGKAGETYEYSFEATDPDDDQVYYKINWGDGAGDSEWFGPYLSGTKLDQSYNWGDEKKAYTITFTAKDTYDASEIETLSVQMPKQYDLSTLILKIIRDRFPLIYQLLLSF